LLTWVNGKDSVSVVLILYLSAIAPYSSEVVSIARMIVGRLVVGRE
jgi:hypothetical protein